MTKALKKFEAWHNTKRGLIIFGLLGLAMAYIVGSRALDTGSWLLYAGTLIFLVSGLQKIIKLIRETLSVRPKTNKA